MTKAALRLVSSAGRLIRARMDGSVRTSEALWSRIRPEDAWGRARAAYDFERLDLARKALATQGSHILDFKERPQFKVSRPLNVGVLCLAGQGGSGNVARVSANALGKAGHHVTLLTAGDGFWQRGIKGAYGSEPVSVPSEPKAPDAAWTDQLANDIVRVVERRNLNLVMVHYAAGLLDAAMTAKDMLAAKGRKLTVSATLHGTDVTTWGKDPNYGPKLKELLERCDDVTSVSPWLAQQAQETLGLSTLPLVVPNSIDEFVFNPTRWTLPLHEIGAGADIRRRLAPKGEVVVAHVSNFRDVKRPLDAVETFAKIRERGLPAKLLLIGQAKPEVMAKIYERAEDLKIAEHIIWQEQAYPDELSRLIVASDLLLVTSQSESFCLAALEALSCGVPVVGTRCGGLEDVMATVRPDENGRSTLLAGVGDIDGLASRCIDLICHPSDYLLAQWDAVRVAVEHYPRDRQEALYLETVERMRPGIAKS